jgi:hypothetical protein
MSHHTRQDTSGQHAPDHVQGLNHGHGHTDHADANDPFIIRAPVHHIPQMLQDAVHGTPSRQLSSVYYQNPYLHHGGQDPGPSVDPSHPFSINLNDPPHLYATVNQDHSHLPQISGPLEQPPMQRWPDAEPPFISYFGQPEPAYGSHPRRVHGPMYPIGGPIAIPGIDGLNRGDIAYRERQANYYANIAQRQQQRMAAMHNEMNSLGGLVDAIDPLYLEDQERRHQARQQRIDRMDAD